MSSSTLGRVLPRPESESHPNEIRQLLNPYKALAARKRNSDFQNQIDELRQKNFPGFVPAFQPLQRQPRCKGHFWDAVNKRMVTVDLGPVTCYFVRSYRAAPSVAVSLPVILDDEPANILSRGEGAASCEFILAETERTAACEERTGFGQKSPGTYVIPGQSPMGETFAQKTGGHKC